MFIADAFDVSQSVSRVLDTLKVVFLQHKNWPSPELATCEELSDHLANMIGGVQFFVLPDGLHATSRKIDSYQLEQPHWVFDYSSVKGWIELELGGWVDKKTAWMPGSISSNNSTDAEKALFRQFKLQWLKGYKKGPHGYYWGVSALKTLDEKAVVFV